ncbi:MAG: hypothetical protein MI724_09645 [Spirochaetales bacterium]|nr:hypothetical protein [Spirochaetales bacterium]
MVKVGRAVRHIMLISALLAAVATLVACVPEQEPALDFLVATEGAAYDGVTVSEERIEELRADIERYREEIRETTVRLGRVATFQRLLARELMEAEMYGPALEALEAAMEIQTDNANLYYLAGVATARSARARAIAGDEAAYYERAERLYRAAIDIRPDYREALYGLTVLLTFELDRPEEALSYARRLAEVESREPSVQFLFANVLVRNGLDEEAAAVYGELARNALTDEQRRRAAHNRDALTENR